MPSYGFQVRIRPLDPASDRAALLDFLRSGEVGLSENKYAFVAEPGDRPGAGLLALENGDIRGYVGLAPAQPSGEWAMELVSPLVPPAPLIEAAFDRAREEGARRLRWWIYDPRQEDLPPRHGFAPERELVLMARPLPVREGPVWKGLSVSGFRPGADETQWLEVNNAAFAGHPENGGVTLTDLRRRMSLPWFDPEGLRMAWDGPRLAGFCWTKIHGSGNGEIYIICVSPAYQGRGLGRALVLEGMRHLAGEGCDRVFLYTEGDNRAAIGLYRDLGYDVDRVHRSFIRDLAG